MINMASEEESKEALFLIKRLRNRLASGNWTYKRE